MQRLLRILHVSDVHVNLNAVARLAELAASGHYDVVIVTGDLANYNHSTDPNAVGAESDAHNVLCGIEQGHLLPVYWLPGNHDSGRFFQAASEFKAGNRAINCHGKAGLELAPGLQICGIGGAVPATQGGYIVWEGFPLTEQQTGDLLQRVWAEQCRNPSQVLLLTHCGPDEVGTTICTLDVTQEVCEFPQSPFRHTFSFRSFASQFIRDPPT